ncbi:MAG: DoxX family protein [Beutenbergiaceae bacterium]
MTIALWIINGLLAAMYLFAGGMKAARPPAALVESGMAWVADSPPWGPRVVGSVELLGAVGLILPLATGIAPILTPLAATGLALLMAGASVVHVRRKESPVTTIVLAALATTSAVLGFLSL